MVIFSIAVIVFLGGFLISLVSFPSTEQNVNKNHQNEMSADQSVKEPQFKVPEGGIHQFMGKSESEVRKIFGDPQRIDETKYGYRWFIYGRGSEKYVQIGIDNKTHKVTTLYALGKKLKTSPFVIGDDSRQIYQKVPVTDVVSLNEHGTKIKFEFNEEDLMIRPLIKFGNDWAQLNFDHISNRLVGVRYMSANVLALQHPYSMTYEGPLPAIPAVTDKQWTAINEAEDREIFDISNVLRMRYKVNPLKWDTSAQRAAYKHSREMKVRNYFSHDSRWSGDLKTRLQNENISFQMAGENIAARYPDSIAVTLGWLNSVDHRKNLLNNAFTELGVGTYQNYYTQDFVEPIHP
ncbi:serine protease [Sporolactobacillus sp. THM7-4]|nr:serine protease [Sporolactobacillus sp. THM7-4]